MIFSQLPRFFGGMQVAPFPVFRKWRCYMGIGVHRYWWLPLPGGASPSCIMVDWAQQEHFNLTGRQFKMCEVFWAFCFLCADRRDFCWKRDETLYQHNPPRRKGKSHEHGPKKQTSPFSGTTKKTLRPTFLGPTFWSKLWPLFPAGGGETPRPGPRKIGMTLKLGRFLGKFNFPGKLPFVRVEYCFFFF